MCTLLCESKNNSLEIMIKEKPYKRYREIELFWGEKKEKITQ